MLHEMSVQPSPFAAIKSGTKTIESRLFDEKRQQIQVGDQIVFRNAKDANEVVAANVVELLKFPTFSTMFRSLTLSDFGGESVAALEDEIYSFYTKEDEAKNGVVGIRIAIAENIL